ncbi:MAG TPA: rRNA maturation RNase YbeY [Methylocystis sp.]|nr:rRNA maturation RNase YbeY [Methylocystis sp.]
MALHIDIAIDAPAWEALPDLDALAARVIRQCEAVTGVKLAKNCELSLAFCDDAAIRALNAQWRGKDRATNVLSFPTPGALKTKALLGDIVIAHETVAREAQAEGKSLADHTAHMIFHGFLHLIGYDHETPAEAEEMETLERRIAQALGIKDPYEGSSLEGGGS